MSSITEGVLLGIGNPLLDISAHVDAALLAKYNLKSNDAILATEEHVNLYSEMIEKFKVEYVAGGATQNSIRVAQWMLQKPRATTYIGCIGHDAFGAELRRCAEADGVRAEYLVDAATPSGKCAVLVTGIERSLVAHLAAAEKYKIEHLKSEAVWALVEQARVYYSASFFLTVSTESALEIGKHAAATNKVFTMNLAAPFLCQFFKANLDTVSPYWDILFGNETEAEAWAKANNWETTDLKEIARRTAALPKVNTARPRTVVFTHGLHPVVVLHNGEITEHAVPAIPADQIVDTNGAGDAFVGGFLSQYVANASIAQCVGAGTYAAQEVIRRSGCTYPPVPAFSA